MTTKIKTNIEVITILKVFATFLVLYIHGANIYGYSGLAMPIFFKPFAALTNAAVPIFMIVSGYLLFRKPIDFMDNLRKKTWRLAIPFLIWSIFWISFETIGHFIIPSKFENVLSWSFSQWEEGIIGIPFYSGPLYSPLWYVRDLYILSLIAPLIQKPIKRFPVVFLFISVGVWFSPLNHCLREAVTFFLIGGVIASHSISIKTNNCVSFVWIISALIGGVICSIIFVEVLWRISILLMVLFIYFLCSKMTRIQTCQMVSKRLIAYTFMIYVLHGKLLSIIQILYTSKMTSAIAVGIGYLLIPFIVFIVCMFAAILFQKLLPNVYMICNGEKQVGC